MASPALLAGISEQTKELVRQWDFAPGQKFQKEVLHKYKSSVHHPSSSPRGSFFMLAVFRRHTFRLTEEAVSLANVGFLVNSRRRIITAHFDVYFHLWRDGGEDWEREKRKWIQEEEESWTWSHLQGIWFSLPQRNHIP
ncbi:hypothetical protein BS78_K164300 [Paspalum vaginatum]|uniref:Uncharacterized protein n=1 Tax=Paspalum vaginatum TaxID=158149 RepID=A0A9W8CDX2_9POAL|nr:hypothetical protein BS78_K164300 [Paspalum vaginatum]